MKPWAFVPLDDRPCCLDFPARLAPVLLPPVELLGRFQQPGRGAELVDWLATQDVAGAVVSLDMVAWGGLVASRHPASDLQQALSNLKALRQLKLPMLVYQTILRNAPTQLTLEDMHWAERLVELSAAAGAGRSEEQARLEAEIPAEVLSRYRGVRRRNQQLYGWVAEQPWEYLTFALDDSRTTGWNLLELQALGEVNSLPGTDETGLLLLTRALGQQPTLQVCWSYPQLPGLQGLYEDRPLGAVLQAHLEAARLQLGESPHQLWIYGRPDQPQIEARWQQPGPPPQSWLEELEASLDQGNSVVLLDTTFANGGDLSLGRALAERDLLDRLAGYAAWNTLGNRLGTALACLCLNPDALARRRFLFERVADDLLYQADFRWRAAALLGHPGLQLTPAEEARIEKEIFPELRLAFDSLAPGVAVRLSLPWSRLFEVRAEVSTWLI